MSAPDAYALGRGVATLLRKGGIVAFHENDFAYADDVPRKRAGASAAGFGSS